MKSKITSEDEQRRLLKMSHPFALEFSKKELANVRLQNKRQHLVPHAEASGPRLPIVPQIECTYFIIATQ